MALSLNDFGKAVVAAGLLPADELKSLLAGNSSDSRPKDAAALAKMLLDQGTITRYQAEELLAGRGEVLVLGEYVIRDKIGAGGMGQVLKAVHRKMGRAVALKLMSSAAMRDEAAIKRFHREVRAAARLEHENIVTAHAAGEARGMHYLVMHYVEGIDLAGRVKNDGPLSVDLAMDCICQAARGLAYAHGEGIIHRDIKPANLLLDKKGVVKILDMGLARIDGGEAQDGLTGTEQVLGTVDYMSPEQAISTRDCDARADIYSLGCTLWYLLTGAKMYTGDSAIRRLMQHREAPLPSLLATRDDIPWALEKLFHRMVAKKPDDRIQTMDEVVREIEQIRGVPESSRTSALDDDTNLGKFFKTLGDKESTSSRTLTKVAAGKSPTEEESSVGHDDSSKVPLSGGGQNAPWKNPKVLASAAVAAFLLLLPGVWMIVRDKDGDVVTERAANEGTKVQLPSASTAEIRIPPAVPTPNVPVAQSDLPGAKTSSISQTEILTSPNFVWSEPEIIGQGINSPCISGDGLTLLDVGNREGSLGNNDLWLFERKSLYEPFHSSTNAVNLGPAINSDSDDRNPWLSADGLTLLFCSDRPGGVGGPDLWLATRKSRAEAFGVAKNLGPPVNTPAGELGGALSGDALTLVFSSSTQNPGLGGLDLWQTRRKDLRSPFEKPQNLGPMINSRISETHPWLSTDGRVLIFGAHDTTKDESGKARRVAGSGELWMAVRPGVDSPFAERQKLAPPITAPGADNGMPSITADGKLMFFNSKRPGYNKDAQCWISRRVPRAASEAVADPNRNAAEWALSVGGRVSVFEPGKSPISVGAVMALPKGPFLVRTITLPMTDAAIRDDDLACLAALSDLSELEFGRVKGFTDAGLKHLSGLIQLKKLTFFDNSQITDAGMKHLAGLRKLEELGLVATQVSDQGLREFIGCPLSRLNVGGRPAADKMMPVIAEFRDLLDLGLHGNVITDNNMLGLQSLTNLQHLGLMGASVTDEGLKTVATLKVQDLHLQGPKFTDGGLKNLEGMTSLTKLSIKDTKATAAGINALKKALPGCKIRWDDPSKAKTAAPAGK